jgi:ribonuclease P protein component
MDVVISDTQRFRFPASRRLKLNREFARVRNEGCTVRGTLLLLGVLHGGAEDGFRAGIITSRRIGGAVVRNRVRRRLREIVRRNQYALVTDVWFVIVARPAAAHATSVALEGEWLRLAGRADLLRRKS